MSRNRTTIPQALDVPEAVLLGERQLTFLNEWGQDWTGCGHEGRPVADDLLRRRPSARSTSTTASSPTWIPTAGRRPAATRPCTRSANASPSISRATSIWARFYQHGIDDWNDAGYSLLRALDRQPLPALVGTAGTRQNRKPARRTIPVTFWTASITR